MSYVLRTGCHECNVGGLRAPLLRSNVSELRAPHSDKIIMRCNVGGLRAPLLRSNVSGLRAAHRLS